MNSEQKYEFERGQQDRLQGKPMFYGCHFGMRSTRDACKYAYEKGWMLADRDLRLGDEA